MTSLENRTNLIVVAIGVVLVAVALYLLMTRRTWFGQHLPCPAPRQPPPGDRPENGPRTAVARCAEGMEIFLYGDAL